MKLDDFFVKVKNLKAETTKKVANNMNLDISSLSNVDLIALSTIIDLHFKELEKIVLEKKKENKDKEVL